MNIQFRDGLIFTSIKIVYRGRTKVISNIVVDTGASKSLISQDVVDDIGIKVSNEDEIVTSYGIGGKEFAFVKKIDNVSLGNFTISDYELDFTVFQDDDINGLLGLDLLMESGIVIDLKKLEMYQS